ncbi:hypothetical protein BVG19_g2366 [[Candida] boidinii]|nr:hypothetical protein BVG19_g2366 [[Candida] boidinii]OWB51390.1 hypothetical protein B5S27_g2950 [[Candida] boidinii]
MLRFLHRHASFQRAIIGIPGSHVSSQAVIEGQIRKFHTSTILKKGLEEQERITFEYEEDIFADPEKAVGTEATTLQYAYRRHGETFGQLVQEVHHGRDPLHNERVISPEEALLSVDPRYRDTETGELLRGATSAESRLHENTLRGRVNRRRIVIPEYISKAINNNMLLLHDPKKLRQKAAEYYVKMKETDLQVEVNSFEDIDADTQIASTFIQDYASAYQIISELRNRIGTEKFNPDKVMTYGYGPATGMLALNDLMGDDFNPSVKDVVINGSFLMERRAKILLSRQANEYHPRGEAQKDPRDDESANLSSQENVDVDESEQLETTKDISNEELEEYKDELDDTRGQEYVGKVKTKALKIKSIIMNGLRPESNQYDLIIASHQLLADKKFFPHQVDQRIDRLIKRLAPGGHLIIVERGNPLGSEIVARVRQVVLRPENNENNLEKIPRLYRTENLLARDASELENLEDTDEIEPELLEAFDIVEEQKLEEEQYHLKVVAPCQHHGKCPLQFSNPEVFKYGQVGKRLKFCNFSIDVQRPQFIMELKRGAKLATKWTTGTSTVPIKGLAQPGRGRASCNDFEVASFSYLILERSANDDKILDDIAELREAENKQIEEKLDNNQPVREIGFSGESIDHWPRTIATPLKKKGFVIADMCAASGHIEKWHISKSTGNADYHDARKLDAGDLWALGKKSAIQSTKENTFYFERIKQKDDNIRKQKKRSADKIKRKVVSDYRKAMNSDPENLDDKIKKMAYIDAYTFLGKPKQQQLLKKEKFKY